VLDRTHFTTEDVVIVTVDTEVGPVATQEQNSGRIEETNPPNAIVHSFVSVRRRC
jgi:hypothetical protein